MCARTATAHEGARSLEQALGEAPTLSALLDSHRQAAACYALVEPLLPSGLASQLRPGPLQDGVWTVFAAGSASASKTRQLLPRLLGRLQDSRSDVSEVRVKVVPVADSSPHSPR